MSKAILISIRKEHNKNIFDGTKHFEGRKTLPQIIPLMNYIDNTSTYTPSKSDVICYVYEPKAGGGCGKVVGQFVCDFAQSFRSSTANMTLVAKALCVTKDFTKQYFNREIGFMLRVCIPERYDKPKELSEFRSYNVTHYIGDNGYPIPTHDIKKPPQSWCYVEKLKGE